MIHPETFLQRNKKGLGLFASRDFKRGEILWIIDDLDVKIPLHVFDDFDNKQRSKLNIYSYLDFERRVIIPWDEGKYINHDCEPNSTGLLQFDNISIALCDIKAGEEIVEDYTSYYGHFETFNCKCGSHNCRRKISSDKAYDAKLRIDLFEISDTIKSMDQYLLTINSKENKEFLKTLSIS